MAGALERQGAPRVDLGLDRLHPIRDPSPGEDPVEAADARDQELEVVDPVADRVGQLGQDAGGLVLFLADRLDEVVVGLDDGLGFDEEGLAALRAVVDDAPHATARLRPDGEDVPPVADRDVPVSEEPLGVSLLEGALELGGDSAPPLADLAAKMTDPGTGVVGERAVGVEGLAESVGELGEARERADDRRHVGRNGPDRFTIRGEPGGCQKGRHQPGQLGAVEDAPDRPAAIEHLPDVREAVERQGTGRRARQTRLARQSELGVDRAGIGERLGRRHQLTTHFGLRFMRQERAHRVPFGGPLPGVSCLHRSPHSLPSGMTGAPAVRPGV